MGRSHNTLVQTNALHASMLQRIQESTLKAAALISQNRFIQGSEVLSCISLTLHASTSTRKTASLSDTRSPVVDLAIAPLSANYSIGCPEWNAEFFRNPFVFVAMVRSGASHNEAEESNTAAVDPAVASALTGRLAAICSAICNFNRGLCYHLQAAQGEERGSEKLLTKAVTFYGKAWTSIRKKDGQANAGTANTVMARTQFLEMAICANMSNCWYHLGVLDSSNNWSETLNTLLQKNEQQGALVLLEDGEIKMHNYFLMFATVSAPHYVAAGTA